MTGGRQYDIRLATHPGEGGPDCPGCGQGLDVCNCDELEDELDSQRGVVENGVEKGPAMTNLPPPLHDVYTAARFCGVSPSWITKLARRHGMGQMIRNRLRLSRVEVQALQDLVFAGRVGRPRKDEMQ